jgi:oligoendopeptidase F
MAAMSIIPTAPPAIPQARGLPTRTGGWTLSLIECHLVDQSALLERCRAFGRHRGRLARLTPTELLAAIRELVRLRDALRCWASYAQLRLASHDGGEARRLAASTEQLLMNAESELEFFEHEWIGLPGDKARALLADPILGTEHYHLRRLRELASHTLPEAHERLLAERDSAAQEAWIELYERISAQLTVEGPDGPIDVAGAHAQLDHPDPHKRADTLNALTQAVEPHREILAHCLDTLIADRLTVDDLRGLQYPRHATDLENGLRRAVVDDMLDAIGRHAHLARRWWQHKRCLLGRTITIADVRAPLPDSPAPSYRQALQAIVDALNDVDPSLAAPAAALASEGHIDARPRPGKASVPFCLIPSRALKPFVLVNYHETLNDLTSLAHELGHAIHYTFAATNPSLLSWAPSALISEIPAILTELITLRHITRQPGSTRARVAVHAYFSDRLCDLVFRQAAIARFEQSAYEARSGAILLEAEVLDELWLQALRPPHHPELHIPDSYAPAWALVPHLFSRPFYNHTYCFAALVGVLLLKQQRRDPGAFAGIYRQFLANGDTEETTDQLRSFGLDPTRRETWQQALSYLKDLTLPPGVS